MKKYKKRGNHSLRAKKSDLFYWGITPNKSESLFKSEM